MSPDATSVDSHDVSAWIASSYTTRTPSCPKTKLRRWPSFSRAGSLTMETIPPRRACLFHATQSYHPRPARGCKRSPLEAESTKVTYGGEEATATVPLVDRSFFRRPMGRIRRGGEGQLEATQIPLPNSAFFLCKRALAADR